MSAPDTEATSTSPLSEQPATNTHWTQDIERKLAKELDEGNQSGQPYVSAMDVRRLLDELYQTTDYAIRLEQQNATRICNCRHSDADYERIREAAQAVIDARMGGAPIMEMEAGEPVVTNAVLIASPEVDALAAALTPDNQEEAR